jgi:parallel beta-helix repeat protein
MISRRFLCFFSLLLLSVSRHLYPSQLVVDQRNPAASDLNPGTGQKPLKTISAAATRVQPGDKVLIHAGEYRETVIIKASGTAEAPIVFEAAPGEAPVIKGSEIIRNWLRESANIWKAKLPKVPIRSNKSDEPSFWATDDVRQVFIKDGVFLDAIHLRPAPADKIQQGNFFCDRPTNELYIWLPDAEDPNQLTIEASMRGAWLYVWGSNVIIRGLQMRHASTIALVNWPACALNGENIVLEDCQLTWGDFEGVGVEGKGVRLVRCTISCHGNSGISGTGDGHIIESCRVIYNNINRYDPAWHAGGAKLTPKFNHGRITRCEFAYNIGPGLWLDDCCTDNFIESNFCHDNEGPGIMVETSSGNGVFNNICYSNRNPLAGEFLRPDPEAVKKGLHNVFASVRRGGELALQPIYHAGDGRGIYISSSPESKVYYNTCYLNEGEGICIEGGLRVATGGVAMSSRNCSIFNNIAAYNKGTQLVVPCNDRDKDTYGNKSDYNLVVALGAVFAQAGWSGVFTSSLKQWQERTGQDAHSIQSDPSFALAPMGDFRPLPSSPAAGAGQSLEEVQQDFFGIRRKNKVSIGACEPAVFDYPRARGASDLLAK